MTAGIDPDLDNQDWWALAACSKVDPDVFLPKSGGFKFTEARAVCGSCPVRSQCLNDALTRKQITGHGDHLFTAGHTPQELNDLRRSRGYGS